MSLPQTKNQHTVEEYLEFEREAEERHEYLDGEVYEMAGESLAHGDICINIARELSTQLRGTPCRALSKDIKVRTGILPSPRRMMKGLFSYPDVLVVCGEPQFHDEYRDVLLNPTLIVEVLSDATEAYDRGQKFHRYQQLESLVEYALVSHDIPLVGLYTRREEGWFFSNAFDLNASLNLASVNCHLRLADVYDRVEFPEDEPPPAVETEN